MCFPEFVDGVWLVGLTVCMLRGSIVDSFCTERIHLHVHQGIWEGHKRSFGAVDRPVVAGCCHQCSFVPHSHISAAVVRSKDWSILLRFALLCPKLSSQGEQGQHMMLQQARTIKNP